MLGVAINWVTCDGGQLPLQMVEDGLSYIIVWSIALSVSNIV
jgi:hypothetical protein